MVDSSSLVNGQRLDVLSIKDRGLQYGDGIFETIAVINGELPFWNYHFARLYDACLRLRITPPDEQLLLSEIAQLTGAREKQIIKLILTRGKGERGYAISSNQATNRVIQISDWPSPATSYWESGIRLCVCKTRLAIQPLLAGIKHLNRLEQVMARSEWSDLSIQEGLVLDMQGNIIEATSHNVFMVKGGELLTPDLSRCGVAGIMRSYIIDLAREMDIATHVADITIAMLDSCDELFLCNSIHGIWPVCDVAGRKIKIGELTSCLLEKVTRLLPY